MKRSSILAGLILIAIGAIFLLMPLFPNISSELDINKHWPLIIVSIGGLFIVGAFLGSPGLAIPGSIIAGIGAMLYYQNVNKAWSTWGYSWALILVFIGIGIIIRYAIDGELSTGILKGGRLIGIGLFIFLILGSILGAGFEITVGLALILIGTGIWIALRMFLRRRRGDAT